MSILKIARSMALGLRQGDEEPDADDERFSRQAAALDDDDCFEMGEDEPTGNAEDQPRDALGRWASAGASLGERIGRGESSHEEIAGHIAAGERLGVPQADLAKLHGQLSRRQGHAERGAEIAKVAREAEARPVQNPVIGAKPFGGHSPRVPEAKPRGEATASPLPEGSHADVLRELHERAGRGETTHEQIEEHVASLAKLGNREVKALYDGMGFHAPAKSKQGALDRIAKRIGDRLGHAERGMEIASLNSRPIQNAFCPTGQGGGVDPSCSPAGEPRAHPGTEHKSEVSVRETKERAFEGESVPLRTKLTKAETGRLGEAVALAWLKSQGMADAKPMNSKNASFPVDLIEDHAPTEVKAGLASNAKDAQKWRMTFSKEIKGEKEAYAKMSAEERTAWNAEKQARIHERKRAVVAKLSEETGQEIHPRTIGIILNPDKRTADIHVFDGFHDIIRWGHESTKNAYVGSVTYDHKQGGDA